MFRYYILLCDDSIVHFLGYYTYYAISLTGTTFILIPFNLADFASKLSINQIQQRSNLCMKFDCPTKFCEAWNAKPFRGKTMQYRRPTHHPKYPTRVPTSCHSREFTCPTGILYSSRLLRSLENSGPAFIAVATELKNRVNIKKEVSLPNICQTVNKLYKDTRGFFRSNWVNEFPLTKHKITSQCNTLLANGLKIWT